MSVAKNAVAAFLKELRRWDVRIKKATYAESVTYDARDDGSFSVTVRWVNKDKTKGEHIKEYTAKELFPRISAGVRLQPAKSPCRVADEIMIEVLQARGV